MPILRLRLHAAWLALLPLAVQAGDPAAGCAAAPGAPRAAALRIAPSPDRAAGTLQATVEGTPRLIAAQALRAWLLHDATRIAYSARDGAGGFEGEGQSLWLYEVPGGRRRKVMAAYFAIDRVTEHCLPGGQTALVVEMHDSGLGATHVAVVDPLRGEVFLQRQARLLGVARGRLMLALQHEDDWLALAQGQPVAPRGVVLRELRQLLRRPATIRAPLAP